MTDHANIARYLLGEAETIPYPDYEAKDGHKADAIAILTELGQAEAERDAIRERAEKAEAKAARFAALLVSAMMASVRVRDSIDQFVADLARALVAAQHELKRASDALVAAGEDLDDAGHAGGGEPAVADHGPEPAGLLVDRAPAGAVVLDPEAALVDVGAARAVRHQEEVLADAVGADAVGQLGQVAEVAARVGRVRVDLVDQHRHDLGSHLGSFR